jgi:hypothetical protein
VRAPIRKSCLFTPAKDHAWSSSAASPVLARSQWMERTRRERKERAQTDGGDVQQPAATSARVCWVGIASRACWSREGIRIAGSG